MGKNKSYTIDLTDSEPIKTFDASDISESSWQIGYILIDNVGDEITPGDLTSGQVEVSTKPKGHTDFVAADSILDLTLADFFRDFTINPDAFKLELSNMNPADTTVRVTLTVL